MDFFLIELYGGPAVGEEIRLLECAKVIYQLTEAGKEFI